MFEASFPLLWNYFYYDAKEMTYNHNLNGGTYRVVSNRVIVCFNPKLWSGTQKQL